ncbi:hypothetical protein BKA81DRAFT_385203 [Phyllosticta paracitricarpa]|uniref:4-coumarate-CoA ligase-like protein n=1 Tax=Phyllosticta paracitricarpa TaxID=2016321 RepID=A0ABR1N5G6_9PEZI
MPFLASEHFHIPDQDILSWSLDAPQYDLDRPVFIDAAKLSRTISARQARGLIERLIAGFKAAGVKKGDYVCMHAFNDLYFSMAFLGINGAGGVSAGINPYTPFELAHAIRTADVEYLLVEPSLLPNAISAAKSTSLPLSRIMVFNPPGSDAATQSSPLQSQHALHDWQWLLSHGTSDWNRFSDHATATSTAATRLFSSGTTGLPKALNVTHHNLIAQHTLAVRRLLCTPMFHVSQANTVPMMVDAVVNSGLTGRPGYSLASLWAGIFRIWMRRLWMTPVSCFLCIEAKQKGRFCGADRHAANQLASTHVRNDTSAFDVSGELYRLRFDADGFFHTGDVAYRDSRTKSWYIVDRKKELIKVRGFQVAPAKIECVLLGHRAIAEAAVIGVVLTRDGSELPRAYVVPNDGAKLSEQEVFDYVAERLAKCKRLEGGVKVFDSIPKNPGGKTLKNQLKEQAKRELGGKL